MLKHIYQIIRASIKFQTLAQLKLKISNKYDPLIDKAKTEPFEEWETNYFLTIYLTQKADDPLKILNSYCDMFFEKNEFNIMNVSNGILYDYKYYLAIYSQKDYTLLLKFIQKQNLAALDAVSLRAKKVIEDVTAEILMCESIVKDFSEGNFQ